MKTTININCGKCGKFLTMKEMKFHYTPDSDYSNESIWMECGKCIKKRNAAKLTPKKP